MQNNTIRKIGISLIALLLIVIVGMILISAVVISSEDYFQKSRLGRLANEVSQVQDAVGSYYILNGMLPIKDELLTKQEVLDSVVEKNRIEFENEINLNGDDTAQFYNVDTNLIELTMNEESDGRKEYILSYPNLNVYDLEGMRVDDEIYFSLSSKINSIVKLNNKNEENNSSTSVENGVKLKVTSNTLKATNKLGINIECVKQSSDKLYFVFSDIGKKEVNNVNNIFDFNSLEELNEKNILVSNLTSSEIETFNNSLNKSLDIEVIRNEEVIAKESLDISNYDVIKPTLELFKDNLYEKMRVIRLNTSDFGSGVKEIRYDYLKKTDSFGNISNYYENISSFDDEYMKTKSKVVSAKDLVNGQVDLKVPIDVCVVNAISVDNAGNISNKIPISYVSGVACSITASPTGSITSSVEASSITYTFTFSEDVVGFNSSDIKVENGVISGFSGTGRVYTLVVDALPNMEVIQRVSISEGVCTNLNSSARNFAASMQLKVNSMKNTIEPQGISLNKNILDLFVSRKETLIPTIAPANVTDNTLTWTSSNPSVASVDSSGNVIAKSVGTAIITVTTVNNKKATCTVNVTKEPITINLDKEVVHIKVGETDKVNVIVLPNTLNNRNVSFSSSNTNIATVDSNGNIEGVDIGNATITVTSLEDSSVSKTFKVVVDNPITLDASIISTTYKQINTKISASTTSGAIRIIFKYKKKSESSYATSTIYSGGESSYNNPSYGISNFVADTEYDIQIIATSTTGYTKTLDLVATTKTSSVTDISLDNYSLTLILNQGTTLATKKLTATLEPSTATYKDIVWGSSNPSVATVDSNGQVTAVAKGETIITVSSVDNPGLKSTCNVKVIDPVAKIEDNYYETLSDAFEASSISSSNYSQITMIKDVTYNYSITFPSGRYATLNTNGKNITLNSSNNKDTIINMGYLNITGTGTIKNTGNGNAIRNQRTLRIQSACTISASNDKVIYNIRGGIVNITAGAKINGASKGAIYNEGTFSLNNTSAVITSSGNTIENMNRLNIYYGTVKTTSGSAIKHYKGNVYVYYTSIVQSTSGIGIECSGSSEDSKTLYIGSNSSSFSTTNPSVSGTTKGIVADESDTNFMFYNGKISGAISIDGVPNTTREGYGIQKTTSNGIETAILIPAEVRVDNMYYQSLQEAFNACSTDSNTPSNIYLLKEIELSDTATFESGKYANLNMDGYSITASLNDVLIKNYGILNIYGSSNGNDTIENTNITAIRNEGAMLLNDVIIRSASNACVVVFSGGILTVDSGTQILGNTGIYCGLGTININDGIISGATDQGVVVLDSSKLNFRSGSITGKSDGISAPSSNVQVNMYGGTVTAINNSGISCDGTVLVTDGSVTGIYSTGTLTIGTNDGNVSTTSPIITKKKDGEYGVLNNGGTFNFYDGKISGGSTAIYDYNSINKPSGYKTIVNKGNNVETVILGTTAVARIGNKYYTTLQMTFDSVVSSSTIYLLSNITECTTFTNGKTANLYLQGYTVSSSIDSTSTITNNGTLNIYGSGTITSSEYRAINNVGTLSINSSANITTTSVGNPAINNTGKVTLNSGIVSSESSSNNSLNHGIFSGSTEAILEVKGGTIKGYDGVRTLGTLNMTGGEIHSNNDDSVEFYSGTMTMTGGSVTGVYGIWNNGSTGRTLTLGVNDSNVSTTSPIVNTTNTAINSNSTTVNFYDGAITGNSPFSDQSSINTPAGYSIVINGNTATLAEITLSSVEDTVSVGNIINYQTIANSYNYKGTNIDETQTFTTKNEKIKCVVIRNDSNGVEIIPLNNTTTLTLFAGVNLGVMDNIANLYHNTAYSIESSSIGSSKRTKYTLQQDKKAILDLNLSSIFTDSYWSTGTHGTAIDTNMYNISISEVDTKLSQKSVWIAKTNNYSDIDGDTTFEYYDVEILNEGQSYSTSTWKNIKTSYNAESSSTWYANPNAYKMGILPIIKLKSGLVISGGNGTQSSPYEISVP